MNIGTLQHTIVDGLEDVKAHDIEIFNTAHLSRMFDRLVIASGTSNRHTRALAMHVREKVKAAGFEVCGMEGMDAGEWVLINCADIVVHIFLPELRQYYRLEEIWGSH